MIFAIPLLCKKLHWISASQELSPVFLRPPLYQSKWELFWYFSAWMKTARLE